MSTTPIGPNHNTLPPNTDQNLNRTPNQRDFSRDLYANTQRPDNPSHRTANPAVDNNGGSGGSQAPTDTPDSVTLPNGQVYTGPGAKELEAQQAFAEQGFQRSLALITLQEQVNQRAQEIQAQSAVQAKKDEASRSVLSKI